MVKEYDMVKECSAGHISSSAPEGGHTFRLPGAMV
jgi:hypothetical protein